MMDFIQFVNDETVIVTDPIFSKEAVEQYVKKRRDNKKGRLSTFVTGKEERSENCCYCDEQHKLDKCSKFREVILKERIGFLQIRSTVMDASNQCQILIMQKQGGSLAQVAKGNHPTPLRWYKPKVMKGKSDGSQNNSDSRNIKSNYATLDNDVKCATTTSKSGLKVISMCIVPVKIKHGYSNKMVTT